MIQEERQELLVALCGYLPYGIKGLTLGTKTCTLIMLMSDGMFKADTFVGHITSGQFKPYLRPMSSMTEEENTEMNLIIYSTRITGEYFRITEYYNKIT